MICKKCLLERTDEDFYKSLRHKSGKKTVCKFCCKQERLDWYEKFSSEHKIRMKNYRNLNGPKLAEQEARRYANKNNATPKWLNLKQKQQILYIYKVCAEARLLTGDEYHVDHIVPLNGRNVCGLHVPWNLQVLPAELNLKKSNLTKD